MRTERILGAIVVAALCVGSTGAQELFVYPSKGQSQAQQDKDKYGCYGWAKGQTGFDPLAPPSPTTPAPTGGDRSVAKGAVGGAVLGAGVGAVGGAVAGGKAGKGAMVGTAAGGLLGGMHTSGQNAQANQARRDWERQEANRYANARGSYNRAFASCMEGRGYSVK